ncbi:hypothetical protein GCM10027345_25470 [Hymenobacter daeguensis]
MLRRVWSNRAWGEKSSLGIRTSLCVPPAIDLVTVPAMGVARNKEAKKGNTRRANRWRRRDFRLR